MNSALRYLRLLARCLWVQFLDWSGFLGSAEEALRERGAILVLTLHRVLDETSSESTNSLSGIVLRERTFRRLVRHLATQYDTVDLAEATPGKTTSRLQTVITFDDGWRDNYTTAFPIIQAVALPVTIFVCPALLGQEQPFWPERAVGLLKTMRNDQAPDDFSPVIERLKRCTETQRARFFRRVSLNNPPATGADVDRTLSWSEVLEMNLGGVRFGSHTNTHPILTAISPEMARYELRQSQTALESALDKPCRYFAYPNGDCSDVTRQIVSGAGFTRAVTTAHGAWTTSSDCLAVPRMNVSESNVVGLTGHFWPAMFRYAIVWKAWRATRRSSTEPRVAAQAAHCAGR